MATSSAKVERSRFSLKRLTTVGEKLTIDDFNVRHEDLVTHSVVRTSKGWSAEVRVQTTVEIDGVVYGGERVVRVPLTTP